MDERLFPRVRQHGAVPTRRPGGRNKPDCWVRDDRVRVFVHRGVRVDLGSHGVGLCGRDVSWKVQESGDFVLFG